MAISDEKIMELWMEHSNQMWRTVYTTPIMGTGVFAGWFALLKSENRELAALVLILGALVMFVQWAVVSRMAQYAQAAFDHVKDQLPKVDPSRSKLNGKQIAQLIPMVLIVVFLLLLVLTVSGFEAATLIEQTSSANGKDI